MRADVKAVEDRLATLGRPVRFGDATGTEPPYYLVELAGGDRPEVNLSGDTVDNDLLVRVKSVSTSPASALILCQKAREVLVPGGRVGSLIVAGRLAWLEFLRHEADFVDRDVAPARGVSVDTYRLISTPV